ncbi:hypothetical protein [Lactobacillus delbrueckii]|uniref:hypothetical protein n=1 Tax=Lactobacillus delbrueckii TaxID=1584 RepID=UPI003A868A3E
MLKTRYQRLIAITLFLDFVVSLGCGLQFAMDGGEGEMPMYYLNANLISLYIQTGLTVMAAVQILSFRSVRPLLAPRGKMDYFDQSLAQLLFSTVPYLFGKNPCFRYGPAWKGTLLLLMHYLLFIACFMLILLCIKIKYPFFIIFFASTVPILYHYWLEKSWLLPKYANIYDPLWRAIHHMYIL